MLLASKLGREPLPHLAPIGPKWRDAGLSKRRKRRRPTPSCRHRNNSGSRSSSNYNSSGRRPSRREQQQRQLRVLLIMPQQKQQQRGKRREAEKVAAAKMSGKGCFLQDHLCSRGAQEKPTCGPAEHPACCPNGCHRLDGARGGLRKSHEADLVEGKSLGGWD